MKTTAFLTLSSVLLATSVSAQVRVGSAGTPNADAVLDIVSSDKGLLLPRVALDSTGYAAPLSTHVAGMVVYNTATVKDVAPGYYLNDGTAWQRVASAGQTWSTAGNALTGALSSTTPQALGSTNAYDLRFITAGTDRMRIGAGGGVNIGPGVASTSSALLISAPVTASVPAGMSMIAPLYAATANATMRGLYSAPFFSENGASISNVRGVETNFYYGGNTGSAVGYYANLSRVSNSSADVKGFEALVSRGGNGGANVVGGALFNVSNTATGTIFSLYGSRSEATNNAAAGGNVLSIYGAENRATSNAPSNTGGTLYGSSNSAILDAADTMGVGYGSFNRASVTEGRYGIAYGTRNDVETGISAGTIGAAYGSYNYVRTLGQPIDEAYGMRAEITAAFSGTIGSAYGVYVDAPPTGSSVGPFRAFAVENIPSNSTTRRVFEYLGSSGNDTFVVNNTGAVGIGAAPGTNVQLAVADGHIAVSQVSNPTTAIYTGAGVGASASLTRGTDVAGMLTLNLGTAPYGTGVICEVNFDKNYSVPPMVQLTPANAAAAVAMRDRAIYVTSQASYFLINFTTAATASASLQFYYQVIESQ